MARLLIVSFSVCPAPDRHGVGMLNVLKALGPRYTVDVLTLRSPQNDLPFVERFMKTRMLRVPIGTGSLAEQVEAFRRAIRRQLEGEEYDVVHLRSAWGGHAVIENVQAPARFVYEVARSTEGEPRAADQQLAAILAEEEQACLERADLVLVPTAGAAAHLEKRGLGAPAHLVEVVPPGVDVDHFDWEPAQNPSATPRVLFSGRIAAGRGVRLLATAVGAIKRKRPVTLMLAGPVEPTFQPLLDEALERSGLGAGDVELAGTIDHDDMPRVIAGSTVCVAPASPDSAERPLAGFPTKLLEYMACRRPSVAPRRSSVEEVIRDGEDGLLFEPGDAVELARALERLLDDAALREKLAESGYRRVRAEHPASATRRRLLEAYARLMPASTWTPPGRAAAPIDALPSHHDTTTAKRQVHAMALPPALADGRAKGEASGEIVIKPHADKPVTPGEIVIEALDFASAGEPFDATVEVSLPHATAPASASDREPAADADAESAPIPADESFSDDHRTLPYSRLPTAPDDPDDDEKTRPGPLRTRRPSG
jgi:glycosyltransferase involved in cell wall biosynthesis